MTLCLLVWGSSFLFFHSFGSGAALYCQVDSHGTLPTTNAHINATVRYLITGCLVPYCAVDLADRHVFFPCVLVDTLQIRGSHFRDNFLEVIRNIVVNSDSSTLTSLTQNYIGLFVRFSRSLSHAFWKTLCSGILCCREFVWAVVFFVRVRCFTRGSCFSVDA